MVRAGVRLDAARVPAVSSLVNSSYGPECLSSPGVRHHTLEQVSESMVAIYERAAGGRP